MAEGRITLPPGLPELTLGPGVVVWAGKYLRHANGIRAGELFRFTNSQFRFLMWFYAVTDEGRWMFDHAARRWPKGSGKARSQPSTHCASSLARCVCATSTRRRRAAA